VYIGSDDGSLYAINGNTGTLVWELVTGAAVESSPAITSDGQYGEYSSVVVCAALLMRRCHTRERGSQSPGHVGRSLCLSFLVLSLFISLTHTHTLSGFVTVC
jgi:hypothetical protein